MPIGEYGEPGAGTTDIGLLLVFQSHNNSRGVTGQLTLTGYASMEDVQHIVDALAGIPGASNVYVVHGQVSQQQVTPDREYEPLPPPPLE